MDFFKPRSKNKVGKVAFIVFEYLALCVFIISLIMNIYNAATLQSFAIFVSGFVTTLIYTALLYGIGRILDFLSNSVEDKEKK